jgi:hypothetical protein
MRQYLRQLERLWRTTVNDLFRLEWSPGRPEESAPGSPEQSAPRDDHGAEPNSAALWQDQDADADARLTSTATTPSWAWLGVGLGLALPAVADHKQRTDESAGAAEEKRRTIAAA